MDNGLDDNSATNLSPEMNYELTLYNTELYTTSQ